MAKKRKRAGHGGAGDEPDKVVLPRVPEKLASPFKSALGSLKKQLEQEQKRAEEEAKLGKLPKPRPQPQAPTSKPARRTSELAEDEAIALSLAMQGVKPLTGDRPSRVTAKTPKVVSRTAKAVPFGRSAEDEARARLDELVAHDVSFRIESEGDFVRAARVGAPSRVVRELGRRTRASETLDLHGMSQREAREAVVSFVRRTHKLGLTVLCIVHGKGQHSEGGLGVLRDCVVRTLTDSAIAQLVYAFVTAPDACGGTGALLVELKH